MKNRHKASSLVLVVVVMAVIITAVFSASRLALVQFNQANRDEDNIFAYYAAKAGIEDGLIRFRYNRDAETPTSTATPPKLKVQRYNLTTGANSEVAEGAKVTLKKSEQSYDMKLQFRGSQIGDFNDVSAKNPDVAKDDFLELTGFPATGRQYFLRYRFEFYNNGTGCDANALVQIQQIQQTVDVSKPISYDQVSVKKIAGESFIDSQASNNLFVRVNPGTGGEKLTSSIRLRPFGCSIRYALATTDASGSGGSPGPMFDNLTSTITSTGYYGDAKRTLIAEIDRLSGQLISVYDFNVYAGTGSISP